MSFHTWYEMRVSPLWCVCFLFIRAEESWSWPGSWSEEYSLSCLTAFMSRKWVYYSYLTSLHLFPTFWLSNLVLALSGFDLLILNWQEAEMLRQFRRNITRSHSNSKGSLCGSIFDFLPSFLCSLLTLTLLTIHFPFPLIRLPEFSQCFLIF